VGQSAQGRTLGGGSPARYCHGLHPLNLAMDACAAAGVEAAAPFQGCTAPTMRPSTAMGSDPWMRLPVLQWLVMQRMQHITGMNTFRCGV